MIKFLDINAQYREIQAEVDAAITGIIEESAFIGGPRVDEFERAFAAYQETAHCVGVGNGTDAIEIALEAMDLPPGSEIIVPANSFIATSEAVTRAGHRVVFCDVRDGDYTISIQDAEKRLTSRTKALIAVHLYGHPCFMDEVSAFASTHGLEILEDCAQAHGARYKGARVGSFGKAGTFSFYPGKNLGAYGDGGAIVTQDTLFAERCRMIANHGRVEKYNHEFEGRNSRLDGLQAAVLGVKLRKLDEWTERRTTAAKRYLMRLAGVGDLALPIPADWADPVWHLFVVRTEKRDALKDQLNARGIPTGIHYPTALPKLKAYAYLGAPDGSWFANRTDTRLLSLPMGEHMSTSAVDSVCAAVTDFFA